MKENQITFSRGALQTDVLPLLPVSRELTNRVLLLQLFHLLTRSAHETPEGLPIVRHRLLGTSLAVLLWDHSQPGHNHQIHPMMQLCN